MKPLAHLLNDAANLLEGFARESREPMAATLYAEMATAVSVAGEILKESDPMGQVADKLHTLRTELAVANANAAKFQTDSQTLAALQAAGKVMDDSDIAALAEPDDTKQQSPADTGTANTGDTAATGTVDTTATGTAATV